MEIDLIIKKQKTNISKLVSRTSYLKNYEFKTT